MAEPDKSQEITANNGDKTARLSFWESVAQSIIHFQKAIASESTKLRSSDYLSIVLVPTFCIIMLLCSFMAASPAISILMVVVSLFVILNYIGVRIGFVLTLNPRQTYLLWLILLATFILGCTSGLLIVEIANVVK